MRPFKTIGSVAVAFGALSLAVVAVNVWNGPSGGHDLRPFAPVSLLIISIGTGLWFGHRWAAALFVLVAGGTGLWLGVGSLVEVPMPWALLNVALASVLIVPAIVVVRRWSELARK